MLLKFHQTVKTMNYYKILDDNLFFQKLETFFCAIMRDHYVHFSKECTSYFQL